MGKIYSLPVNRTNINQSDIWAIQLPSLCKLCPNEFAGQLKSCRRGTHVFADVYVYVRTHYHHRLLACVELLLDSLGTIKLWC